MAVQDGQRVNAQVTNAAFVSRTEDSDTVGVVGFNNPSSGGLITNGQQKMNDNTAAAAQNATDILNLQNDKEDKANKGIPNGYAELDGSGRIPLAQMAVQALTFQGSYDASTNTPTLADGVGTQGDQYRTNVAGTQDLGSGAITFNVGDTVTYNGTIWEKQDFAGGTDALTTKGDLLTLDGSAAETRLGVGTDGQVLVADAAEATGLKWDTISSGSGVGGISYVKNPDAEVDVSFHTLYKDAAQDTPEDGVGGTSTYLLTRTTVPGNIVRGEASFLLQKPASNVQGEGVHIELDPIHPRDKFQRLQVSFDYKLPAPGSNNYDSGDLRFFVYDVDNATLLGAVENDDNGDLQRYDGEEGATFLGFFDATDSLNYRLLGHTTTTDTDDATISYDNVKLGPISTFSVNGKNTIQTNVLSANVTADGTIGDLTFSGLDVGKTYEVRGTVYLAVNVAGSDPVASMDAVHDGSVINRTQLGIQTVGDVSTDETIYSVSFSFVATAASLTFTGSSLSATSLIVGNGTRNATYIELEERNDLATNIVSDVQLTQQTIVLGAEKTDVQNLTNGIADPIIFNNPVKDDYNAFDAVNGGFVCPRDGIIRAHGSIEVGTNLVNVHTRVAVLLQNGTQVSTGQNFVTQAIAVSSIVQSEKIIPVQKGDLIQLAVFQNSGGTLPTTVNSASGFLEVNYLPDFTTYGVTTTNRDVIQLGANPNANQNFVANVWNDITSFVLPAGRWNLDGVVTHDAPVALGGTVGVVVGISAFPGNDGTALLFEDGTADGDSIENDNFSVSKNILTPQFDLAADTTLYLKQQCTITTSTQIRLLRYTLRFTRL